MRNFKHLMIAALAGVVVMSSCSVEKRVHMAGYNVKFNKSYKGADDVKEVNNEFETNNVAEAKTAKFKIKNNASSEIIEMSEVAQVAPAVAVEEAKAPVKKSSKANVKVAKNEVTAFTSVKEDVATDKFVAKKEQKVAKASSSKDDTVKLIIALILCFFLPPLGVWLAYGSGSETRLNLLLFLGGIALIILSVILAIALATGAGLGLFLILNVLAYLLLLASFIHGLIKIIQKLV